MEQRRHKSRADRSSAYMRFDAFCVRINYNVHTAAFVLERVSASVD